MGAATRPDSRAVREPAERVVARIAPPVGRLVRARFTIPLAALAAFLVRLPGLGRPLQADESGFLLVARNWSPAPDSVYGPLFVARPPPLIALIRAADAVAGPYALRVIGALGCAVLVLLAAATARLIADDLTARWTALAVAALCANPLIDVVAVKGELLALPLLMLGVWSALVAVRRDAPAWALGSGLAGGLAIGLKQNLGGSLVFALVLVVATAVSQRGPGELRRAATLVVALAAGALVPVAATLEWAVATGVGLDTLWYTVAGFRAETATVLSSGAGWGSGRRAAALALAALAVGVIPAVGGFLVHLRAEWREDGPLAAAVLAMIALDVAGLVAGGDYWKDYLFPLLVPTALCAAVLARRRSARGLAMRAVVLGMVISSIVSIGWWVWENANGTPGDDEARTGSAIAEAAETGDTLTVFGGQADLQYASGLDPVYPYLWTLQMRVRDPDFRDLEALLRSDEAPEWLVQWAGFETYNEEAGKRLRLAVESRYLLHGPACGAHRVWLRADVERPELTPDCSG